VRFGSLALVSLAHPTLLVSSRSLCCSFEMRLLLAMVGISTCSLVRVILVLPVMAFGYSDLDVEAQFG
jgi:hypothetical protein